MRVFVCHILLVDPMGENIKGEDTLLFKRIQVGKKYPFDSNLISGKYYLTFFGSQQINVLDPVLHLDLVVERKLIYPKEN